MDYFDVFRRDCGEVERLRKFFCWVRFWEGEWCFRESIKFYIDFFFCVFYGKKYKFLENGSERY